MGIDVSIEGLERVLDMMEGLEDKEILTAARHGMRSGLHDMRSEARMLCPKDTGALANSIKYRTRFEGNELVGEVYTNMEYAVYVEMGTGPRGEANHEGVNPEWLAEVTYSPKGWKRKKKDGEEIFVNSQGMPARPFLYPAYKSQKGKVYRKIADAVIKHVQSGG